MTLSVGERDELNRLRRENRELRELVAEYELQDEGDQVDAAGAVRRELWRRAFLGQDLQPNYSGMAAKIVVYLLDRRGRAAAVEAIRGCWRHRVDETRSGRLAVSVPICRARKHLASIGFEGAIETVRGFGYRLNPAQIPALLAFEASLFERQPVAA